MGKITVFICLPVIIRLLPMDTIGGIFLQRAFLFFVSALLITIILGLASIIKFGPFPYSRIKYNDIEVSFLWRLNGGGVIAASEFVRIVSEKMGKVDHVFEYCAGPGFIGFALLANNLCDQLTLADVNPEAIEAIKETIKNNNLQDKVTVYEADCLDAIPATEQWDLVVGNPPWHLCPEGKKNKKWHIRKDPGSRVHEKFYRDVRKFLNPNGSILLMEGGMFTEAHCFRDMIKNGGLTMIESFQSVSFLNIFGNMDEYRGLKRAFVITLRFMFFINDIYFIWSKPEK
jgi:hypothetical protein